MIRAHSISSPLLSLLLFSRMRFHSVSPDLYTFPLLLKACSLSPSFSSSFALSAHSLTIKLGFIHDIYVQNTLIRFYCSSGRARRALQVFDEMPHRDPISWSALISGLASTGWEPLALSAFRVMQIQSPPDEIIMLGVISSVTALGDLDLGIWIHSYILKRALRSTVALGTALVSMFAACGSIARAGRVFDEMPERNLRAWTAMIDAFAEHGRSSDAVRVFDEMTRSGLTPDHVTFIGVLTACSRGGLLNEGRRLFRSIKGMYGIEPILEHYGCMVDLMGRAGLVNEAHDFVLRMPIRPNLVIWRTLLGACVNFGYVEVAEQVKERIAEMDEHGHDGDYVLLSNVYGGIGRWAEKDYVRCTMRHAGIAKTPGCSLLGN
ncbi:Tetratricopeptide-like helical domain-containing protein [Dioscorea alata]|uniref:Tetratricopeptide-like helical domain-containing protein n=1 Tax=Dioscorea alata TaxID=55571 RepID=A0ACB7V8W0_DIOAL|nr:Tetratricopeptide-like helical domain-containing protein [Dioscorea alata]